MFEFACCRRRIEATSNNISRAVLYYNKKNLTFQLCYIIPNETSIYLHSIYLIYIRATVIYIDKYIQSVVRKKPTLLGQTFIALSYITIKIYITTS